MPGLLLVSVRVGLLRGRLQRGNSNTDGAVHEQWAASAAKRCSLRRRLHGKQHAGADASMRTAKLHGVPVAGWCMVALPERQPVQERGLHGCAWAAGQPAGDVLSVLLCIRLQCPGISLERLTGQNGAAADINDVWFINMQDCLAQVGAAPEAVRICGVFSCKNDLDCSNGGTCQTLNGTCTCRPGFAGAMCGISLAASCNSSSNGSSPQPGSGALCCAGGVVDLLGACCPSGERATRNKLLTWPGAVSMQLGQEQRARSMLPCSAPGPDGTLISSVF